MAKELPYFQFEPAEYLTKDISFCSLSAQGLFINICAYYWQRECNLTKDQLLRRLNNIVEFNELLNEGVIDLKDDESTIIIKFLDVQFEKATKTSKVNSANGSKGGRPKKINPIESEIKPKLNPIESETKGIREDKRIEDKIKEDKKKESNKDSLPTKVDDLDFDKLLLFINQTFGKQYRVINKKTRTAYNARMKEGYKKLDIMNAVKNCKKSKTHIEQGFQYATPEFFSRSTMIDKYMNEASDIPKDNINSRTSHVHVTKKVHDIDFVDPDNL